MAITIQTGAHQFTSNEITHYSLMLGGMNAQHDVLRQYDPLVTGFYRLFMVRKPQNVVQYLKDNPSDENKFNAYKHILEYGNRGVSGLSEPTVEFKPIEGGFSKKQIDVPVGISDDTNRFTVKVQEFSGSIMREVTHLWVNSVVDLDSGLTHYNGLIAAGKYGYAQANNTAEFIYVVTDRTGMKVEYACHLCNCFPTKIPTSHFESSDSSDHNIVELDLEFTCMKREGIDVNEKAKILLRNNQIMVNSLEYCTMLVGDGVEGLGNSGTGYNPKTGKLEVVKDFSKPQPHGSNDIQDLRLDYKTAVNLKPPSSDGNPLDTGATNYTKATPSYTLAGNDITPSV